MAQWSPCKRYLPQHPEEISTEFPILGEKKICLYFLHLPCSFDCPFLQQTTLQTDVRRFQGKWWKWYLWFWTYKHCQRHNGPRHCLNFSFIITQSRQHLGVKRLHRKRMSKPNPCKCIFNKQSQFRSTSEACNIDKSCANLVCRRYPD